ncbi:MAG: preprotein translocase subunit SecA, partial [Armatimonadetes bacterium]|nr:preprotein translocase subunit SecA [Armatimonadota bacterium]
MLGFIKKLIDPNEREIARLRRIVDQINALEPDFERLTDEQLTAKTEEFKQRLAAGETLDALLPEAYAAVREAAKRTLGQRHFDVQVMGAIVLHEGKIAEMKTGEGKTLTATMPLYLNALEGKGAHLVTTNDFLVRWQAQWMAPIFELLGMSVGFIQHEMSPSERRAMYNRDVTYVQNAELGFDYLRDNMANSVDELVLRDLHYAIVDEVDSILIDEARTPLIIAGRPLRSAQFYHEIDRIVRRLRPSSGPEPEKHDGDYWFDEKTHQAGLTEEGQRRVEQMLGIDNLSDPEYIDIVHHLNAAIKAHALYKRDVHYVVKDGQVIIVDEFTGHLQPGRRYSDGLHEAIEAKEGVRVQRPFQTVATITYQNLFRMYKKLAGMTGTAKTEEAEFRTIYRMPVVVIPTNKPVIRTDYPDVVYRNEEQKFRGIVTEIINMY